MTVGRAPQFDAVRRAAGPHRLDPRASGRRAFTLVELCLGLVVTALVVGAVASFALALSTAWRDSEQAQGAGLASNQTLLRLRQVLGGAKRLGYCQAGSLSDASSRATLLIWLVDGQPERGTEPDGKMQVTEMAMLDYNAAEKTLDLYTVPSYIPVGAALPASALTAPSQSDLAFARTLPRTPLAGRVLGTRFSVEAPDSTYLHPRLRYEIRFDRRDAAGRWVVESGVISLRSPAAVPTQ